MSITVTLRTDVNGLVMSLLDGGPQIASTPIDQLPSLVRLQADPPVLAAYAGHMAAIQGAYVRCDA